MEGPDLKEVFYGYGLGAQMPYEQFQEVILRSFVDDGWRHDGFSEAYIHMQKKREQGIKPTWVKIFGTMFMTGEEWYDKFKQAYGPGTPSDYVDASAYDAAKKVAGIK